MKTASFTNFSTEPFTGYWDGKPKTFQAGQTVIMPDYLARHFAKHLTNRELLKLGKERDTSPKVKVRQDGTEYVDNINFLELFNKAYKPDADEEFIMPGDSAEVQTEVANRNADSKKEKKAEPGVQVADLPVDGDDDEDFEESANSKE